MAISQVSDTTILESLRKAFREAKDDESAIILRYFQNEGINLEVYEEIRSIKDIADMATIVQYSEEAGKPDIPKMKIFFVDIENPIYNIEIHTPTWKSR